MGFTQLTRENPKTKITSYHLRDSIIDELHLMELSSHESVDDIINEVSKKFEIK